jgi:hypothetical protein
MFLPVSMLLVFPDLYAQNSIITLISEIPAPILLSYHPVSHHNLNFLMPFEFIYFFSILTCIPAFLFPLIVISNQSSQHCMTLISLPSKKHSNLHYLRNSIQMPTNTLPVSFKKSLLQCVLLAFSYKVILKLLLCSFLCSDSVIHL